MKKRIAIIATMFHKEEAGVMLSEARTTATKVGLVVEKEINIPGCYEIPLALKKALQQKNIDGAVVLGIIEKGQTKHGLVMGIVVHDAIVQLELATEKPVGKGILGPDVLVSQIKKRLKPYAADAVLAVKTILEESK